MISVYQFAGITQIFSDHVAFTMTGHPSTSLVVEELNDCLHTSFYYSNSNSYDFQKMLLAHQNANSHPCKSCNSSTELVEHLKHPNPAGVMALRRYRGEGNNRISTHYKQASSDTMSQLLGSDESSLKKWQQHNYLSQIKWEINILTREDVQAFLTSLGSIESYKENTSIPSQTNPENVACPYCSFSGESTQLRNPYSLLNALDQRYLPSESSVVESITNYIRTHRKTTSLGNCADSIKFVLDHSDLHKLYKIESRNLSCKPLIVRPGSMMGVYGNIAEIQSQYLQQTLNEELLSSIRDFSIKRCSLAHAILCFCESEASGPVDSNTFIPHPKEWLRKLYGDVRGTRLVGIDGYRYITDTDTFYDYLKDSVSFPHVYAKSLSSRLGKLGIGIP